MGLDNPYTALVDPRWRTAPSVYGPVATWTQLIAAVIGGSKPWLTIWALMVMTGIAFLAAGYLLLRSAADPVRASLIWVANPLLIYVLVMGAQLDVFLALVGIAAILISRRGTTIWHDLVVGVLIGVAAGIKINAGFVALGIAVPLIRAREWGRLLRTAAFAAVATVVLYFSTYGVSSAQAAAERLEPDHLAVDLAAVPDDRQRGGPGHPQLTTTLIGVLYLPLMLALAWYLYNRLSPDVPAVLAATCALTFAWVLVAPWSLPWYTALAWVTLALLPRNSLTRWLTLATFVPAHAALQRRAAGQPPRRPGAVSRAAPAGASAGAVPGLGRGGRRRAAALVQPEDRAVEDRGLVELRERADRGDPATASEPASAGTGTSSRRRSAGPSGSTPASATTITTMTAGGRWPGSRPST